MEFQKDASGGTVVVLLLPVATDSIQEEHRRRTAPTVIKGSDAVADLISEPITGQAETFDADRMGQGEPGLPAAFVWRDEQFAVVERLSSWKHSQREGGKPRGERYLRRHYYKLRMNDDSIWTVYFIRQTPGSGNPKVRWFLYTIERPEATGCERSTSPADN